MTPAEAIADILKEAAEGPVYGLEGADQDVIDELAAILVRFIEEDTGNFVNDYGRPYVHTAINAWVYAQVPASIDLVDKVINGCFTHLQEGADDYSDTVETAKILSIFESHRASNRNWPV